MAERAFGDGDATFQALGRESGIRGLVESFYRIMDSAQEAEQIRQLHPPNLDESIEKLICFLSGWTGGPKLYAETYRPIRIPQVHIHLPIGEGERDAWLSCMKQALAEQPYENALKRYMLEQLCRPAEQIRLVIAEQARQPVTGQAKG